MVQPQDQGNPRPKVVRCVRSSPVWIRSMNTYPKRVTAFQVVAPLISCWMATTPRLLIKGLYIIYSVTLELIHYRQGQVYTSCTAESLNYNLYSWINVHGYLRCLLPFVMLDFLRVDNRAFGAHRAFLLCCFKRIIQARFEHVVFIRRYGNESWL